MPKETMPANVMRWQFTPKIDFTSGNIEFLNAQSDMRGIMHNTHLEIIRTKEKSVREALIALGWTPPPETPQ